MPPGLVLTAPVEEEWIMLFQCDSDREGRIFGDSRALHFMMRRQDLKARDFSRVLALL